MNGTSSSRQVRRSLERIVTRSVGSARRPLSIAPSSSRRGLAGALPPTRSGGGTTDQRSIGSKANEFLELTEATA
jgi:hypothetical protein